MKKSISSLLISFLISLFSYSQSTFTITTTGTTPTIDSAITYATDIWGAHLLSNIPIKLNVIYTNLTGAGPLGITFPNGRKDFTSAPQSSTWYASCLANAISNTELNTGEVDMDIYMNSANNYYFGLDANPGNTQYDFISVLLHEIAHGLGMISSSSVNSNEGSFGLIDSTSFAPLYPTFPFPSLDGLPTALDRLIVNGSMQVITDTNIFANISLALKNQFESNDLFFNGFHSTWANNGNLVKVYAPSSFESGSSINHIDENSFPVSSGNSMMTPFISNGEANHQIGDILLGLLNDIGWNIYPLTDISQNNNFQNLSIYPNPSNGKFNLDFNQELDYLKVNVYDITGKKVFSKNYHNTSNIGIDLFNRNKGVYIIEIISEDIEIRRLLCLE